MPDQPLYLNIPLVRSSFSALWCFLDADFYFSSESLLILLILPRSHLSLSFVLCTHLTDYFFLYVLLRGLTSCVSSASLPCLTGFPVTSSTGYFFTGPLFPLATLSSCDLHCGVPEISAPFVISLYDRTSPAFCPYRYLRMRLCDLLYCRPFIISSLLLYRF